MIKLGVSNIAWPSEQRVQVYGLLRDLGVSGIEVAPTKFGAWDDLNDQTFDAERRIIEAHGLAVCSYQALYFGRPDLQLLGDEDAFQSMLDHTIRVARIASRLSGGGKAVFGAPRNRLRGDLSEDAAFDLGRGRLTRLSDAVAPFGVTVVLESAPKAYGGDFLETAEACARMVKAVDSTNLRLHLDTGCMTLGGETPARVAAAHLALVGHVHLSEPQLVDFAQPSPTHQAFAESLRALRYDKWIVIEMRESIDPVNSITGAVKFVQGLYADPLGQF